MFWQKKLVTIHKILTLVIFVEFCILDVLEFYDTKYNFGITATKLVTIWQNCKMFRTNIYIFGRTIGNMTMRTILWDFILDLRILGLNNKCWYHDIIWGMISLQFANQIRHILWIFCGIFFCDRVRKLRLIWCTNI